MKPRQIPPADPQADGLLELDVGEAAQGGWCVAREPSGRVVLVRHALPGERVLARVTGAGARLARADAVQVLAASPDRVAPPCPHAHPGGCGGCDWQHAAPDAQRRLKAVVIRQQLRRIAGLDREITVTELPGDPAGLGWRTRVRFAVGPDGTAGLRRHRSHDVIDVGSCPIAHPLVNQAGVTARPWPGAGAVQAVTAPGTGQRALVVTPESARWPGPSRADGRYAAWAGEGADPVLVAGRGGRLTPLRGGPFLRHAAAGRDWRVSAGVFWQVHPAAAGVLAAVVAGQLQPRPGDVALDLYCGAGLFAGMLAGAVGPSGTVIGIESDPAAVRDARHNLRATPWARVHRGDAAELLGRADWAQARIAVLDPPRAGAGRAVLSRLLAAGTGLDRVAYVSCDPATLARDIGLAGQAGWKLDGLRAFDAFPMTHHVECVATLTRG
ncbi:MAG TPA: methyltransferase domain-containing protein [Streptosporangiaceae bacterium]|nr:methyltransferase domain-containing protein [Streptosporangiaceae bacterium]